MTRRSIRQQRKQREAERSAQPSYGEDYCDNWSPRRVKHPQWFLDHCEAEWNSIPDDLHELRKWMKGEPINPVGPNGERL